MKGPSLRIAFLITALTAARAGAQVRIEPVLPRLSAAPSALTVAAPSALSPVSILGSMPAPTPPLAAAALPAPAPLPVASALAPAAAAPAVLRLAASADGPRRDEPPSASSLDAFWDGTPAHNTFWSGFDDYQSDSVETLRAGEDDAAGSAAPFLSLQNPQYAAALDAAVTLARTTDAGRRALDAAEKALAAEGRTLSIDVKDLGGNWGEYDYLEGRMRLHRRLFEKGREAELAGTLAHELLHVSQHAAGLPSNALELEIEAHLQDLALMNELGLRTPPHTFARQTEEALKKGPAAFIALIQLAVPGSPFLGESSFADIIDQLEGDLDSALARRGPRAEKYAQAIERDLKSLRSKKGRAAYKAFSQRVLAELKRRASGLTPE